MDVIHAAAVKIHLEVLRSEDCFGCGDPCCKFDARYPSYAPLFTDEQRRRVDEEHSELGVRFEPHGSMWRIVLREAEGSRFRLCPLLEPDTRRCRVYSYGVFDCDTYPYQVMERDGRLLLTVTPECPVVADERLEEMRAYASHLIHRMREAVERHPERVIPHYEGVVVLADLGPARSSPPPR